LSGSIFDPVTRALAGIGTLIFEAVFGVVELAVVAEIMTFAPVMFEGAKTESAGS
jgi:hypothetical protein